MKTALLIVAGFALGYLSVSAIAFVVRAFLARRMRIFHQRRVTLEQVTYFKVRGCKTCGGSGEVKRQKMRAPCSCAAKAFLAIYARDTKMLGPFRVWKRGRGPNRGQDARRSARSAAA